ncbi:MAG: hypothetical protein ACYSSI_05245 [Planctomycetota bacterium]|jgi:hypothetical protein
MNRTQKGAWANLIIFSALGLFGIILFIAITFIKTFPIRFNQFYCLLIIVLMVGMFLFLRKKQSDREVDSDERDNLIKLRAVQASFVSVWILLAAAILIPRFFLGITGTISLWVLSIIAFAIFLVSMIIYNAAILIQYGWRGKDGQK